MTSPAQHWLGIDAGGTFTDFVLFDGSTVRIHKRLSTPQCPEQAILDGLAELGIEPTQLRVIHGSTVATNAVLERKGVRTVYITNRGLADVLTIGRQARRQLYELQPAPHPAPVPAELCIETGGRLGADGSVVEPLSAQDLAVLHDRVRALAPQAVAINLLFSFLDDRFERAIEAALPHGLFVARSSQVLPEYKEYERGIATWLNAWVGPLVERYLTRLQQALPATPISVMQSSGGTIAATSAGRHAVHMLLSGPAGGLCGARKVAGLSGRERLLSFDMGGTSTDVALLDGELQLTNEGRIAGYPVAVPMVDIHTIGAGGGSIARVDPGGLLQVGPESAGATPGPACYGRGGQAPTVTDANVVLGRLPADARLGGTLQLDPAAARAAIAPLAQTLGLSVEETALGIVRIADEHIVQALRVMSIQRGIDPRHHTLVSFGGAGGLHVCALAQALGMSEAMVPIHAGVLSALGMLAAPRARTVSRTLRGPLRQFSETTLLSAFAQLESEGRSALVDEGVDAAQITAERSADLRYIGQSSTLRMPWTACQTLAQEFQAHHEQRYGHRLDRPVELVNLRVHMRGPLPRFQLSRRVHVPGPRAAYRHLSLHGTAQRVPLIERDSIAAGEQIIGPAIISEPVATTFIAPSWRARADPYGNLLLER